MKPGELDSAGSRMVFVTTRVQAKLPDEPVSPEAMFTRPQVGFPTRVHPKQLDAFQQQQQERTE